MIAITDDLLAKYGVKLLAENKAAIMQRLQEQLEELVGLAVIEKLNDDDAKELMKLSQEGNQEAVVSWVAKHVTDYEQIVKTQIDLLLGESTAK